MKPTTVELNIEVLKPIVEMAASHELTVVLENFKAPFDRVSTFNLMQVGAGSLEWIVQSSAANFIEKKMNYPAAELTRHLK